MDASRFSGRLKELREAAGMTQKDLADRVGTSVRQVSRLETAAHEPTWPTVVALAGALGVDCRAFLEEPTSTPEPQRGRPLKVATANTAPKRPRGRPKNANTKRK